MNQENKKIILEIRVVPGAKTEVMQKSIDGSLKLWIKGKPIDGEANRSLIQYLAKEYKVSKSSIQIVRGHTSRNKIVEISFA